jgi:3-hydroxyacyl-CoA dehydrogenase
MSAAANVPSGVGVLWIDAAPLNVLAPSVIAGLCAELERLERDPDVQAIVVAGRGRHFSAGADIDSLDAALVPPGLSVRQFVERLDGCLKVVVAAIDGVCLGGGLEVAMACDARVAAPAASLGLPEVKLGLIPGAGGTQRLPRLVGTKNAYSLIASGESVGADQAAKLGLVDVVDAQPLRAAARLALDFASQPKERTRERSVAASTVDFTPAGRIGKSFATDKAAEAIEAARSLTFQEGLRHEAASFDLCLQSAPAKALIYLFKAERQGNQARTSSTAAPVSRVAVIGGGAMGRGIALACLESGLRVVIIEASREGLEQSRKLVSDHLASAVLRGRLTADASHQWTERLSYSYEIDVAASADLVIETISEDMSAKRAVFTALGKVCGSRVILATNTSSLDIDAIADNVPNPQRVVGLHFFSPANVMRLLEIVRGRETSDETIATAMMIAKRLRKAAVVVKVGPGFAANRMLAAYLRQATLLLEEGALPHQVDAALRQLGFAMGPFAVYDLSGTDIALRMAIENPGLGDSAGRPTPLLQQLVTLGRLGQKSQSGWYRYEKGSREPLADDAVSRLLERRSAEMKIARREITPEEIRSRCLHAIVNEACRILDEGLVERGSDIDVIWTAGFGFPKDLGGPLFWADRAGLAHVVSEMERLADVAGVGPAPLLRDMADGHLALNEWRRQK